MHKLRFRWITDWALLLLFSCIAGCSSSTAGTSGPKFDPDDSTAQALREYDANGDQKLSKDELQKCAGLRAAIDRFDSDHDGAISAEELKTMLIGMVKQGAGIVELPCLVRRGGQPLENATIKFIPEDFFSGAVKIATGVTGPDGTVIPSIPNEDLPAEIRGKVRGVPCGIFRVEVTHPSVTIPAKFNTQTTIGRLVTRRDHEMLTIDL